MKKVYFFLDKIQMVFVYYSMILYVMHNLKPQGDVMDLQLIIHITLQDYPSNDVPPYTQLADTVTDKLDGKAGITVNAIEIHKKD